VSPQNIVVGADGTSRLIDFGIAKAASRLTPTTTGAIKGKFSYMSPEQIRQQPVDRRADVFAAGVVLHEALTSTRLFKGDDDAATLLKVMVAEVPDPSSIVPGLPRTLDAIVHRALALDREERFPTAGDFAGALEQACPPASPRAVAALVARLCVDVLDARRQTLRAAFERPAPAVAADVASSAPSPASASVGAIEAPPLAGRRGTMLGTAGLLLVATVAALAIVGARLRPAPAVAASTAATISEAPESAAVSVAPEVGSAAPAASLAPPPSAASASHRPPRSATTAKPRTPNIHLHNPYLGPGEP
jgi:serine/threonine-protein kinase